MLFVAFREKKSQRKRVLMLSMKKLLRILLYFNIYIFLKAIHEQGQFVCSSVYRNV